MGNQQARRMAAAAMGGGGGQHRDEHMGGTGQPTEAIPIPPNLSYG
jgi:hypothetical protein